MIEVTIAGPDVSASTPQLTCGGRCLAADLEGPYLTVKDICRLLPGRQDDFIYGIIRRGLLKAHKIGRQHYVKPADWRAYLDSTKVQPDDPDAAAAHGCPMRSGAVYGPGTNLVTSGDDMTSARRCGPAP